MGDDFEKWREQIHKNNRGYIMETIFIVWIAIIVATAFIGMF